MVESPLYGIDTEFHRERTYYPRLALLQISWPSGIALVDPLAVDVAPLRAILDDVPDILAPAVLERLRPLGYTGGVTILRARLRELRVGRRSPEAFLTLRFAPGEAKTHSPIRPMRI